MADRFRQELWITDLSGGNVKQLTSADRTISGHDWSPDGRRLYFGSNRRREFEVWSANVDTGAVQGTNLSSANPMQLSVGRSGERMVYSDLQQDLNIWKLDLEAAAAGPTAGAASSLPLARRSCLSSVPMASGSATGPTGQAKDSSG